MQELRSELELRQTIRVKNLQAIRTEEKEKQAE